MAQGILNTPREVTHQRIAAALEAIEQNMSDEHEAVNIDYDNTYSGLSADNVQEAIDELVNEKADKSTTLAGYGITDAYTKTETDTLLDGKVDKITGKGLSTNDYTTADKNKLADIEAEANKTVVDSSMSDSSTNPLQNKVITKELEGSKTATGNPLTVTDAAPVNAVNLSVDLEPIQAGSGTPSPNNIRPISGRTEENIIVSRPNLYIDGTIEFKKATAWTLDNTETAQSITGISASGNVINGTPSTSYFWMHIPFSFRKNRTVYLKFNETPATSMFRISNSNGQYITHIDTKDQYTPSEDFDGFIDLGYDSALFTNYKIGIGYTSTFDIDAYNEKPPKTYTIQLGETVYGGQLDVTRGKMVVDRGYIASYNGETLPSTWISDRDVYASGTTPTIGAEVVYELATPFTIDLTPQQIKLLENTNTIYTDYEGDTITIEYQLNNAIGEAVRAVEESYDPEFAARPVLKKKAFSGTTDSDGAVTLINASDIPSNHRIIPLQITDMTIGGSAGTYFVEYKPYNSGDSVKGYCYTYHNGSQTTPVGTVVTGNFYYYDLEG